VEKFIRLAPIGSPKLINGIVPTSQFKKCHALSMNLITHLLLSRYFYRSSLSNPTPSQNLSTKPSKSKGFPLLLHRYKECRGVLKV